MKQTLLILFTLISVHTYAQNVTIDIFDNLEHESRTSDYEAFFKKDIFDDFEFTDTHKNKLHFNKKYILANYPLIYQNKEHKISFFQSLIHQHEHKYNLEVSHEIDILDNEIISDNRNNKTEISTDIFDNKIIERYSNGSRSTITKSIEGEIEYCFGSFSASLEKGFNNEWDYEDSTDNEFTFSEKTWRKLINRHGSTENVFIFILDEFTNQ